MGRMGTGAGQTGRGGFGWREAIGLGLAAMAAACDPGGSTGVGPNPATDSLRFAHTLVAAPGPRLTGPGGGGALSGADPALVWAPTVSPEATDRLAAHHCADLGPFGSAPWRIPTADELARAPLDQFPFVPGDLLWTVDRPEGAHHRRVVIDPVTGARQSRAPAQALHLRVLCVAEAS